MCGGCYTPLFHHVHHAAHAAGVDPVAAAVLVAGMGAIVALLTAWCLLVTSTTRKEGLKHE